MQGSSDFPAPRRAPAPLGPGAGVVGALFATFALGFTEGCLEIARRPIPLRFALRFAAANLLPSAVWSSVSACDVATASGVPSSALIRDGGSSSMSVGKRLVLVKSVRALRMAAGSYGLAWSLWRWHEAADGGINDSDGGTACGESVVRLAPVNSPLSRASRRKHGEHIVTVPLTTESWKNRGTSKAVDAVDWENVGVQVEDEDNGHVDRVKVLEVELGDAQAATFARKLKANAVRTGATLCSVAVLPLFGEPLPMKIVETFTVCFNPMSAVLTFVASVCRDRGVAHVCLVQEHDRETADADTEGPNGGNSHFSTSQLATGLLYLHGITTTVVTTPPRGLVDEQEKDEPTVGDSGVVFFISDSLVAGQLAAANMAEQGLTTPQDAFFIVEESLGGQSALGEELQAHSALLETAPSDVEQRDAIDGEEEQVEPAPEAKYLSVADVSDQTLQGIRTLVRQGKKPDAIQAAVYRAYGPQRVVAPPRHDHLSNVHV